MAQITEIDDRIAKCNKILDENPNSQIFAALAEAYRKKGEIDKAFRICQSGLKTHPEYGSAHVVMAKINLDKGLYDWAEMEANKANELEGTSRATEILLAEIYVYRGELVEASKMLKFLKEADPGNDKVTELLDLVNKLSRKSPAARRPAPIVKSTTDSVLLSEEEIEIEKPSGSIDDSSEAPITIDELFARLSDERGVQVILLADEKGTVLEIDKSEDIDIEDYGTVSCELVKLANEQIDAVHFGDLVNILIEARDYIANLIPLRNNLMLFIKAESKTNLGSLRMKINPLLHRLEYNIKEREKDVC